MGKRKLIQIASTIIYNLNINGIISGKIFKGETKNICVPGLNCYSCPMAVSSCPLGSLQNSLSSPILKFPFYILGLLFLFGILLGRLICGFLCPFGLIQELLYKIPTPKIKKNKITYYLSYLKYIILGIFVIFIPLYFAQKNGIAIPGFCKYICPAGTLTAGIPLILKNTFLQETLGNLFILKLSILIIILLASIFIYRPFCRFICPLGAIYSLFNKYAIFGIKVEESKCIGCNKCIEKCKMDVKCVGDKECIECGECKKHCPTNAITYKNLKKSRKDWYIWKKHY